MFEILQRSLKTPYKRQKVLSFCVAATAFVVLAVSFLAAYNLRVSQKLGGEADGLVETLAAERIETAGLRAAYNDTADSLVSTEQEILEFEMNTLELEASIADLDDGLETVSGETTRAETKIEELRNQNPDKQISEVQVEIDQIREELN